MAAPTAAALDEKCEAKSAQLQIKVTSDEAPEAEQSHLKVSLASEAVADPSRQTAAEVGASKVDAQLENENATIEGAPSATQAEADTAVMVPDLKQAYERQNPLKLGE